MADALEREVQAIARRIAEAGASERAQLFHLGRWSERILDWALSNPEFKTQLFRFVDVFPACRDDEDVLRHLSEYFEGVEIPRALRLGLGLAERVPLGGRPGLPAAVPRPARRHREHNPPGIRAARLSTVRDRASRRTRRASGRTDNDRAASPS